MGNAACDDASPPGGPEGREDGKNDGVCALALALCVGMGRVGGPGVSERPVWG